LLFTSLGTAIAAVLEDMQGFQMIMNFLVMPIFFLSGALFPLHGIPLFLEVIAKFDPLSYGIDGFRQALISQAHFGIGIDITVLSVVTILYTYLQEVTYLKGLRLNKKAALVTALNNVKEKKDDYFYFRQ
jgi:ABC-2 type transport system permease protein